MTSENILLAIETSGDVCGIAVLRNGELAGEYNFRHGMHLSERLLDTVEMVLQGAGASRNEITAYAIGIGPGSFTGTRVGVMTAKMLASVQQKPLYGVGGMDAVAAEYAGLCDCLVVPLLPCRAGVIYACPFLAAGETPEPLAESAAFPLENLAELLNGIAMETVLFCGSASAKYRVELEALLPAKRLSFGQAAVPRAAQVARLAHLRSRSDSDGDNAAALVPLYISPPPITQPKTPYRPEA